jgi:hypothetical protein
MGSEVECSADLLFRSAAFLALTHKPLPRKCSILEFGSAQNKGLGASSVLARSASHFIRFRPMGLTQAGASPGPTINLVPGRRADPWVGLGTASAVP